MLPRFFYTRHPQLIKYVSYYVIWQNDHQEEGKIMLPSLMSGIGFTLQGTLEVKYDRDPGFRSTPAFGTRCTYRSSHRIKLSPDFCNISARLTPDGLCMFTSTPLHELMDAEILGAEYFIPKQDVQETGDQLANARDNQDRIRIFEQFLLAHFRERGNKGLQYCLRLIGSSRGTIRINELSAKTGISERQLHRLFINHIGIAPKEYLSLTRFRSLITTVHHCKEPWLRNSLLESFGDLYYDQAHFIKEFRKFTSITPGSYLKSPSVLSDFYKT